MSSCEKAAAWRTAGRLLAQGKALADVISFQAAISACDRAEQMRNSEGARAEMHVESL